MLEGNRSLSWNHLSVLESSFSLGPPFVEPSPLMLVDCITRALEWKWVSHVKGQHQRVNPIRVHLHNGICNYPSQIKVWIWFVIELNGCYPYLINSDQQLLRSM